MYSVKLETSLLKGRESFDYARWHVLNYVLEQGDVKMGSHNDPGRKRPSWDAEEFATVVGSKVGYFFYVEPHKRKKDRKLEILAFGSNKESVEDAVAELTKNTNLERV